MESRSSHNRRPLYGNGVDYCNTKGLAKRLTLFPKGFSTMQSLSQFEHLFNVQFFRCFKTIGNVRL